jgi:hypothetical protein
MGPPSILLYLQLAHKSSIKNAWTVSLLLQADLEQSPSERGNDANLGVHSRIHRDDL